MTDPTGALPTEQEITDLIVYNEGLNALRADLEAYATENRVLKEQREEDSAARDTYIRVHQQQTAEIAALRADLRACAEAMRAYGDQHQKYDKLSRKLEDSCVCSPCTLRRSALARPRVREALG